MGEPADRRTRQARKVAHAAFDQLWVEEGEPSRELAYQWLAAQLELEPSEAHMAKLDLEQCRQVFALCAGVGPEDVVAWAQEVEGAFEGHRRQRLHELRGDAPRHP
jgi:hypothetical protein